MSVNTEIARKEESRELKRNARVHSDTATGPRAVLGSQQPRTDEGEQIGSTPPCNRTRCEPRTARGPPLPAISGTRLHQRLSVPFQKRDTLEARTLLRPGRARSVGADYLDRNCPGS